ncbi:centromere/kinetochore protein zw10 homolog [Alosa sapidissima]|uniref:centromere/kinetochore protein zw10 homolog n=1 Tax=Alosa sapidissima TaxID=34773 RepID=UPI001C091809|nr:centromere/kinetochore protein zw10 homolog [Alosa sapidissima]
MTSFVTEVLASSGKLEKDDLMTKISKLTRKSDDIKAEATYMIKKEYDNFLPTYDLAERLGREVEGMYKEIDDLRDVIENEVQQDLNKSVTEFTRLGAQLGRTKVVLNLCQHLVEFDNALNEFHKAMRQKEYVLAAEQHGKAQDAVSKVKKCSSVEIPLLTVLMSELTIQKETLLYHLGDEWAKMVTWTLPPPSKELTSAEPFLGVKLHLSREGKAHEPDLANVLQALAIRGDLQRKITQFAQLLLRYMLKPVILHPSLVVEVSESSYGGAITAISLASRETSAQHREPPELYQQVLTVLKALHEHPFNATVGDQKVCEMLGGLIWEELSESIIQNCLVHSIPARSSQLDQYAEVITQTKCFESSLQDMGYLREEATDLLKYAQNYNRHFISRKCQDVIVEARRLMTSEIHDTVKISPDYKVSLPALPRPAGDKKKRGSPKTETPALTMSLEPPGGQQQQQQQLEARTMALPACRVSRPAQQILELAVTTLAEAADRSNTSAIQILFAVRNIFHLFCNVVPTYHEESLLKIPQLAAIHHNDCMFLAHHLITLGHHFGPVFTTNYTVCSFVDLVPSLRRQGTRCFMNQMNVLRGEILESLSTARDFSNLEDKANSEAANKAVRQVVLQLKRVGRVWQDVLPVNIYCKAMGTLLNTAVSELISRILALEDISSEEANFLHGLCEHILVQGPQVFTPVLDEKENRRFQEEVSVYATKWMAFKELAMVLLANLNDILNRWAEGKGPLALAFSYNEVKGLIRALFQNTDRRAAALAQIGPSF